MISLKRASGSVSQRGAQRDGELALVALLDLQARGAVGGEVDRPLVGHAVLRSRTVGVVSRGAPG